MALADLIVLAGILGVAVGLRVAPRWRLPNAISSDGYFHLAMSREIRDHGLRLPPSHSRLAMPHRYTYPFLYHWLLALFSRRGAERVERVSSAICDAGLVLVTWFVARRVLSSLQIELAGEAALWSAGIVAVAPALLRVAGGPRAFHGTPRTIGQLLFAVWSGGLILHSVEADVLWLLPATAAVACLSITSKFGNQAVVFFSVLLLAYGRVEPMATAVLGLLLMAVVTGWRSLHVLEGQVAHSRWYVRYLQRGFLQTRAPGFRAWLSELKATRGRPRLLLSWLLTQRFWVHLVVVYFFHLPLFISLALVDGTSASAGATQLLSHLLQWFGAGVALTAVVSLRPLLFLGEPERYLENTQSLQAMGACWLALATGQRWLLVVALVWSLALYACSVYRCLRIYRPWQSSYQSVGEAIRQIDEARNLVYPLGRVLWQVLYLTNRCRILQVAANLDERRTSVREWQAAFGNYPYPEIPVRELAARLGVTHVVAVREDRARYEALLGDASLSDGSCEVIVENRDCLIWQLDSSLPARARAA